ncbi:unnamed protein product [Adineta steineri]|uniref:COQ9 C-terminal domain-containing protein n=1 Tax=Adineta steineri TaxID=433720 RepID=A0A815KWL7_9BILA|nr:unnamed protein product [Adineta steineri]CAF1401104.1 unnamed protein product [Adineta steineri]
MEAIRADLANDALLSIGDTSTDIKWYLKRLSIATIYQSAEIYMLQDQTIGSVRSLMSQSLSDTAQVANELLTVVRTMTIGRQ